MANDLSLQPKRNKKLIILIIIAVVFLILVGGATWFLLFSDEGKALTTPETLVKQEEIASFLPINEPFSFNVKGRGRGRLVQVSVQLQVRGDDNYKLAMDNLSLIQSSIDKVFRSSTVEELKTEVGRKELRRLALESAQSEMLDITKTPVIEQILFTDFVMQ